MSYKNPNKLKKKKKAVAKVPGQLIIAAKKDPVKKPK